MSINDTNQEFIIKIMALADLDRPALAEYLNITHQTFNSKFSKGFEQKSMNKIERYAIKNGYYCGDTQTYFIKDYKNWGGLVLKVKLASGLNQDEFAEALDTSSYVCRTIFDGSEPPNIEHLKHVFRLMDQYKIKLSKPLRLSDSLSISH